MGEIEVIFMSYLIQHVCRKTHLAHTENTHTGLLNMYTYTHTRINLFQRWYVMLM